ncbi:MAG: hypothetical protein M1834_007401 [Cirrosporium novae-zelandiae]|nr:MAG: hypothetical protein M1834_007401 [Cirrosporium novae-zelandiae]
MVVLGQRLRNLTTRLEAATSRLEDIAAATDPNAPSSGAASTPATAAATIVGGDHSSIATPPPEPPKETLPVSIEAFDEIIDGDVKAYMDKSQEIGGLVAAQSATLLKAFTAERKFLLVTTKAKKPDMQSHTYMELFSELHKTFGAVNEIREANRGSPDFNHLTTVSESVTMLSWVGVENKPADFITESLSTAQYYGNNVLREYKDKDQHHIQWVKSYYKLFQTLAAYVKKYYPNGLTWNNKDGVDGKEALDAINSKQAGSPGPTTSAPAPPPPPPLPKFDNPPPPPPIPATNGASGDGGADMGSVFAQISQGPSVTASLRKVDKSEMTHKNPSLRSSSLVPHRTDSSGSLGSSHRGKSPAPGKKPKPESMRTKKPPKKELDGNKWLLEHFDSPDQPITLEVTLNQSILISRCSKTTIILHGKANAISIDNSPQLALVIDSLVSSVDVIKSPKFAIQVQGALPTLIMDAVDGATVYLGKESVHTEILTSKCTSVNINVPEGEEGDYKECALPEQVRSFVKDGKIVSEIVEHAG